MSAALTPSDIQLVLASASPRRRELLQAAGIAHIVRAASIDESVLPGEEPVPYVRRMAAEKARGVVRDVNEIVLAADTTVVCAGQILGKPEDTADARRMLELLSGRAHQVITGVCLLSDAESVTHAITTVWFEALSPNEIDQYIGSGESMDKAGAYGIQGIASRFIDRIEGSYTNVVGLPIALVWRELRKLKSFPS